MSFQRCLAMSLAVLVSTSMAYAQEKTDETAGRAAAEKKFSESLSHSKLVGHYTLWGQEGTPKKDTYTIDSATKQEEGYWTFVVRIQYDGHDVKLPLRLKVLWAGDTPVITLNKVPVPKLGTFSARVVFNDGQYAGVWDGGNHGGHLYGKIEKQDSDKQPQK